MTNKLRKRVLNHFTLNKLQHQRHARVCRWSNCFIKLVLSTRLQLQIYYKLLCQMHSLTIPFYNIYAAILRSI